MTTAKKSMMMLLRLTLLYIISACISIFVPDVFLLRNSATVFLMAVSLSLMIYFSDHIIERSMRKYLVGIAGLITLWSVLRGAKYISFDETGVIARHIWYLYYIPALFIPLLSLFAALSVGTQNGVRSRRIIVPASGVTLLLALMVLTNDFTQLVFRFKPGFADWDSDYAYAPVFCIILGWITLLFIAAICILFSRCRVSASRRLIWVPMLPALFGISYLALYAADVWPRIGGKLFGEFPETVCFTVAGIWLSLVYIGLFPSNEDYGRLFELSDLAAQIADSDLRVIYKSANAAPLSGEQLASTSSLSLDRNTRVHRKTVTGGFVYWQDDITALNKINEELWKTGEQLSEEAELLRLQNELKEERAKIEAKAKVYDEIAAKVLAQSQKMAVLCAQAEQDPDRYVPNMRTVCLLAVFIKRYANLALLAADQSTIDIQELSLAVQESLRQLREMGVHTDSSFSGDLLLPAKNALSAYTLFEQFLEEAIPSLRGVQVSVTGNTMKLTLEGAKLTLPEDACAEISEEDHVFYVKMPLIKAGESV